MDPTAAFLEMVRGTPAPDRLARGAFALAAHARPELDLDAELDRLDTLATGCEDQTIDGVRRYLFDELGFTGRADNYYAPENSFLDQVVESRRGIPISLSLLVIETGRRAGVPFVGIGMPGHFLVRSADDATRFLDPFAGGVELDAAGAAAVFRRLAGAKAPFKAAYLLPVDDVAILGRMAANLVNAYRRIDDRHGMRWAARLRAGCPGVGPGERIALSQTLSRSGAFDEAAELIERSLPSLSEADADRWRSEAARLRAQLN